MTLIEIPYWWDNSQESLKATVYSLRPDLIHHVGTGKPIPSKPVPGTLNSDLIPINFGSPWKVNGDPAGW